MRSWSLRSRMTVYFAGAIALCLLLFSAAVVAVLAFDDESEEQLGRDSHEDIERVLLAMAVLAPVAIGGAAVTGRLLAGRAVAPLLEAGERARRARTLLNGLDLPVTGRGDEWDQLAGSINALLGSTRDAFVRVRRFTADAAHELRTPLTALLGETELALRRDRTPEELRAALQVAHAEGQRLATLVEKLLVLARADAGSAIAREPVALDQLVRDAVDRARSAARSSGRSWTASTVLTSVRVLADAALLGRAVDNLLENALRHGGEPVSVELTADHARARLVVADAGAGVPAELVPRLFERFACGDESRSSGGSGLGLALVKSIAEAHGGAVTHSASAPGARFTLELPLDTAAPSASGPG